MKITVLLFLVTIFSACKLRPDNDLISTAAIHFSDIFITKNIESNPNFRVKGIKAVNNEYDSVYTVIGTVEGYSPMNYPVSIEHFNETLRYLGGNPNEEKNWTCIEIYIGKKKIK